MKTRNALYLAAIILIVAAIVSLFENANLIWATLMVVVAAVTLVLGVVKEQKLNKEGKLCKPSNKRRNIVITGVALVFLGLVLQWANSFIFGLTFKFEYWGLFRKIEI